MRFAATTFASAAILSLAACGGSDSSGVFVTEDGETGEYSIDNENGETSMTIETEDGDVSFRAGADVPVDLPAGFSLISGAEVLTNTIVNQEGSKGALVTFMSDKSPEEIADFYRSQAEDAGITIQIETTTNGGKMIGGENEATGTTFSVTAYPGDDGTTGQLMIGEEPG